MTVNRSQVVLGHPIKTLGLSQVRVVLHPEVSLPVTVNVARSPEAAEKQSRGERVGGQDEDEPEAVDSAELFEPGAEEAQPS